MYARIAIQKMVIEFGVCERHVRESYLREKIRGARKLKSVTNVNMYSVRNFELPGVNDPENPNIPFFVCRNSFQNLFALTDRTYKRFRMEENRIGPLLDARYGNKGRRVNELANKELEIFFTDITEFSEPYATRFIRELTGVGIRDSEVDVKLLPTYFTKRNCYMKYCYGLGYKVKTDSKGNYGKIKDYVKRVDYETMDSNDGYGNHDHNCSGISNNDNTVVSWAWFRYYWRKHHPLLKINLRLKIFVVNIIFTHIVISIEEI